MEDFDQYEEIPVFRATSKPFTCSKCLCVEYMDCINIGYLSFLISIQNAELPEDFPFDIDKIRCFTDIPSMFEWYIHRKHQNPLLDLVKEEYEVTDEEADEVINTELSKYEEFISIGIDTVVNQLVHICINNELADRYVIFHNHYLKSIEDAILDEFGKDVEFLYGDFEEEIMDQLPEDNVTYFFSDIEKVNVLIDNDRLDYNSIVLPIDYDYNKDDDGNFLINFEELGKYNLFKYAFMEYCE